MSVKVQPSIMVVDDTPANLRVLERILRAQGYEVRSFPKGHLALRAVQVYLPDAILLDILMPEMDGFEVCQRLKEVPRTCDIPIIFISAVGETMNKVQAFALGAVDYITKPFQVEEVLARVGAHLSLWQLQKSLNEEINLRRQAESALQEANAVLEQRVHERTSELLAANRKLHIEINERRRVQAALHQSNLELEEAYNTTLEGWSRALELRDQETEGHSKRVVELTLRLARALGVNGNNLIHVRRGALLHDIGKMGVPDRILLKPGPLTDEEWDIMRQHPTYARQLLKDIHFLRPALDIPYYHHEKWDGSGYPSGLQGEEIPLPARIFAVVDVWDALCADRPYRSAWPQDRVYAYLREQSGKYFDPKVVEMFLEMVGAEECQRQGVEQEH